MFILKNAWISIERNKGRNILIGIIIAIIACACTITLAIKNTSNDLITSYMETNEKEVTISFDRSSMMKDFDISNENSREDAQEKISNISSFTIEDVKDFANSDYVESYYYTYTISLNGNNIEKAENSTENLPNGREENMMQDSNLDFSLVGYDSIESMSEFINGTYEMQEIEEDAWDIAFSGNYAFINEELAEYNGLQLSDSIVLEDEEGNSYDFKIIGIYEEKGSGEPSSISMFSNSVNTIITNAAALETITQDNDSINGNVTPTFIIDSYDNVEALQDEFYEKGLDSSYVLQTNEESTSSALSGISNVDSFATIFLIIILIIGGAILFIINVINIRERKYEIGVLRTIGISKFKLTMQFVSELLMIALIALTIGAGLGSVMSKNVSNYLLANEIENSSVKIQEIQNNFGMERDSDEIEESQLPFSDNDKGNMSKMIGAPTIQAYESIDAVVDMKVVLELLVVGLSLVLIGSLASMMYIQRFSPLDILRERS